MLLIRLSIIKTFFLLCLFKTTKCNEGLLSSTFLEMDRRRPQPPKELESKGPQDYAEYTLALVQNQRPEQPHKPQASHTPSVTLPGSALGLRSWLSTSNNWRRVLTCSHIAGRFHSVLEGQQEEILLLKYNSTHGILSLWVPVIFIVREYSWNPSVCILTFWVNQPSLLYKMWILLWRPCP